MIGDAVGGLVRILGIEQCFLVQNSDLMFLKSAGYLKPDNTDYWQPLIGYRPVPDNKKIVPVTG